MGCCGRTCRINFCLCVLIYESIYDDDDEVDDHDSNDTDELLMLRVYVFPNVVAFVWGRVSE